MKNVSINSTFGVQNGVSSRSEVVLGSGPTLITIVMSRPGSFEPQGKPDRTMSEIIALFTEEFFENHSIQILNLTNLLDENDDKKDLKDNFISPISDLDNIIKGDFIWEGWGNVSGETLKDLEKKAINKLNLINKTRFKTANPYCIKYKNQAGENIKVVLDALFPKYVAK